MIRRRYSSIAVILAVLVPCVGCGDTGSDASSSSSSSSGGATITPVTSTVGSKGGTVSTGDVSVTIPAGALPADTEITISPAPAGITKLPDGVGATGDAFAFTPHGLEFVNAPIVIAIPHDGRADVVLGLSDEADTTWEDVPGAVFEGGMATFATTHFSLYMTGTRCEPVCAYGEQACAPKASDKAKCNTDCINRHLATTFACSAEAAAVASCYTAAPISSDWECASAGYGWPKSTTCAAEYAAFEQCAAPSTPPASCGTALAGNWYLPSQPEGNGLEMYFVVLSDRVAICASDMKSRGGYAYTCPSTKTLSSKGGVCGWDSGYTMELTSTAPTATFKAVNPGAGKTLAGTMAAASTLPAWCIPQIEEAKMLNPIPVCP